MSTTLRDLWNTVTELEQLRRDLILGEPDIGEVFGRVQLEIMIDKLKADIRDLEFLRKRRQKESEEKSTALYHEKCVKCQYSPSNGAGCGAAGMVEDCSQFLEMRAVA